MRHKTSENNPFPHTPRFAFGYDFIDDGDSILDYGCFDGAFGRTLLQHRNVKYYGIDKNIDAIMRGKQIKWLNLIEYKFPLPFPDAHFDKVFMFEVLEHIADQDQILNDIYRVIKQGGVLVVSVPRRHIFSALDLANFKFVFPQIHKLYYTLLHSRKAWEERYSVNPHGLVGDIENKKLWHQHFSDEEMHDLLRRNGFQVIETDAYGLFNLCMTFLSHVFRLGFLFPQSVRDWDSIKFHHSGLLCAARKH